MGTNQLTVGQVFKKDEMPDYFRVKCQDVKCGWQGDLSEAELRDKPEDLMELMMLGHLLTQCPKCKGKLDLEVTDQDAFAKDFWGS